MKPRALLASALTVAVGASFGSGPAAADDYWGPGYHTCNSFRASGYVINVSAKRIRCRTAVRIQREYWLGPRRRKTIVNGGSGASGYVLLHRFPGWRCGSGAGAGACRKGNAAAAYHATVV